MGEVVHSQTVLVHDGFFRNRLSGVCFFALASSLI